MCTYKMIMICSLVASMFLVLLTSAAPAHSFSCTSRQHKRIKSHSESGIIHFSRVGDRIPLYRDILLCTRGGSAQQASTCQFMLNPASASILAGSVAGAVGVGVAYPFDTLKTKAQIMGRVTADELGMIGIMKLIWKNDGIGGFFLGVQSMMIGKALIKAVAFWANTSALNFLLGDAKYSSVHRNLLPFIMAASFSGLAASFVVTPVERIKVLMQATGGGSKQLYKNEAACAKSIIQAEGLRGLMLRGLNPTLTREIPSYCLNFVVYELLMGTTLFIDIFGQTAPLIGGALSGVACWLPTYPMDVVKTLVQNTDGTVQKEMKPIDTTIKLFQEGGVGAFFNGIVPKLYRAAISHAVTFFIYERMIMCICAFSLL